MDLGIGSFPTHSALGPTDELRTRADRPGE